MTFEFDASELKKELEILSANIKRVRTQAFPRIARAIVQTMQDIVPVDTGALRDSIKFTVTEDGVEIKAGEEYASFVEFGTINMDAQPFFDPGIEAHRNTLVREIEIELKKGLTK